MEDFNVGDKIRITAEGVITRKGRLAYSSWVELDDEHFYYLDGTTVEVVERHKQHDYEADPLGTLYRDKDGRTWIKMAGWYNGPVIHCVENMNVYLMEDARAIEARGLTPIESPEPTVAPEVGDRNYGWRDGGGDVWWPVKAPDGRYAWSTSPTYSLYYTTPPSMYGPYTPVPLPMEDDTE